MNEFIVYKHTTPSNKVYIGITCKKLNVRWGRNGSRYINNKHFFNAILKYGWDNIKHEILYTGLSKEDACKIEIELISKYKSNQYKYGYNQSSGGDCGATGVIFTQDRRNKISNVLKGKKKTKEHCIHMSQSKTGIKHTKEQNSKIKLHNIGKHKGKLNGRCKPIVQYDLDGNYIRTYDYTKQASDELNICRQSIIKCCKGIYNQAGGYKWQYNT